MGGFPNRGRADSSWRGGSRPGFSGEIARGLFGGGASGVGPAVEDRQPEPAAPVAGCGPGRHGPGLGGEDRRHGPPDLRDWVHRFNAGGPDRLIDNWTDGPTPRLSANPLAEVATIVTTGPDRKVVRVVRWRRIVVKGAVAGGFG